MSRTHVEDSYPLSPMQEGMLFHTRYAPRAGVDIEQMVCVFRERLDVAAFRAAWDRVVAATAVLRTSFRWEDREEPLQEVHTSLEIPWLERDLRALSPRDREAALRAFLEADRAQGFDPKTAPLLRLALFRVAEAEHRFVFTFHHMVLDGGSFPLVIDDVFLAYEALRRGHEPTLPARRPFRDFIHWLRAHDTSASRAFWREALRGFTAPTPLGGKAGEARSVEIIDYGDRTFTLPNAETAALSAFGARHRISLNTILQAAWSILLARYGGEPTVVFGATRSGRRTACDGEGVDGMVGVIMNTLPVRIDVRPEMSVLAFLTEIQAQGRALRAHEHTPLVDIRASCDLPPGAPLFESLFVFGEASLDAAMKRRGGAFAHRDFKMVRQTNFPLVLIAYGEDELPFELEYDRRRFDEPTIDRLVSHLKTLLLSLPEDAQRAVGDLSMISEDERHRLFVAWNGASIDHPRTVTLPDLFEAQAALTPDAVAVTFGAESLTYAELDRRGNQLAAFLRENGVGPDVPVALCLSRSMVMAIGIVAIFKAGGAYLSLDPEYPADRLAFMMADARPPVLLTQSSLAGKIPPSDAVTLRLDVEWSRLADLPTSRPPRPGLHPDCLAYLIYTSGSTGKHKGVAMPQRPLVNLVHWQRSTSPGAFRTLQFASSSFDVCFQEHFSTWASGGTLVLLDEDTRRDPERLWQTILDAHVERLFLPPVALYQLAESFPAFTHRPCALREIITAGEALQISPRLVALFEKTGATLRNQYGPSETHVVTEHVLTGPPSQWPALPPIGRPIHNVKAYLLDEHRRPVPEGVRGELYFGGAQVARGYLNRPDLTADRFIPDPFSPIPDARMYRTGDLGRWLPTGDIEFLGRADFQVKIRGFRVELGEIETTLAEHESIKDAVVVARGDTLEGRKLVAYLTPRTSPPAIPDLRAFLAHRLPDYMLPAAFVVLDALPLTASGKVNRLALPTPDLDATSDRAHAAPRGPVEEALSGIFAEVLRLPPIASACTTASSRSAATRSSPPKPSRESAPLLASTSPSARSSTPPPLPISPPTWPRRSATALRSKPRHRSNAATAIPFSPSPNNVSGCSIKSTPSTPRTSSSAPCASAAPSIASRSPTRSPKSSHDTKCCAPPSLPSRASRASPCIPRAQCHSPSPISTKPRCHARSRTKPIIPSTSPLGRSSALASSRSAPAITSSRSPCITSSPMPGHSASSMKSWAPPIVPSPKTALVPCPRCPCNMPTTPAGSAAGSPVRRSRTRSTSFAPASKARPKPSIYPPIARAHRPNRIAAPASPSPSPKASPARSKTSAVVKA
ncbi:Non-ribosomal peptide synthase [Minicystis rosea]|nr:Non-ribosomal peptide synthase [Minicystis rosea]